jgi:hypothetical protein
VRFAAAALLIKFVAALGYDSLDYDMTALAPAIAFLAAQGMRCGFAPTKGGRWPRRGSRRSSREALRGRCRRLAA